MKRAKIILFAILIFSVVGGAFAYEVESFPQHSYDRSDRNSSTLYFVTIYTHKPGDPLTLCTVPLPNWTTTNSSPYRTLATFDSLQPCVLTFITPEG